MGVVRARWILLIAVLAGGCAFEKSLDDTGGDDQPADTDGDGKLDSEDNCVDVANADQRNHDMDARGDLCDLCPHIADDGGDSDNDQIGDACDPRAGIDTLIAFDGFYDDSTAITSWTKSGGTWSISGGALRQTGTNTWAFFGPPQPIARVYADYAFTPLSVGPAFTVQTQQGTATIQPSIGNFAGIVQQQRNYGCAISKDPSNRVTAWASVNGSTANSPKTWGGDLTMGQRYRVVENMTTQNRCDFTQGTTITDNDSENLGATDGTFVFSVAASTVEIDYIFLVSIGT